MIVGAKRTHVSQLGWYHGNLPPVPFVDGRFYLPMSLRVFEKQSHIQMEIASAKNAPQ